MTTLPPPTLKEILANIAMFQQEVRLYLADQSRRIDLLVETVEKQWKQTDEERRAVPMMVNQQCYPACMTSDIAVYDKTPWRIVGIRSFTAPGLIDVVSMSVEGRVLLRDVDAAFFCFDGTESQRRRCGCRGGYHPLDAGVVSPTSPLLITFRARREHVYKTAMVNLPFLRLDIFGIPVDP